MGISRNDAAFYDGLRAEDKDDMILAVSLYEKALEASLIPVKEAARDKLVRFLTAADTVFPAEEKKRSARRILKFSGGEKILTDLASYILEQYDAIALSAGTASGETSVEIRSWERAVALGAAFRRGTGDEAERKDFFFTGTSGPPQIWLFGEWEGSGGDTAEAAAIRGRLAVLRGDYGPAMNAFSAALDLDPSLFLTYPELLGDLGRAFQYSGRQDEGAELFARWAEFLETGDALGQGLFSVDIKKQRYMLRYFGGRIERQRQRYSEAAALFSDALALAPDDEQADACIWYILSLALNGPVETFVSLLGEYGPRWKDSGYFSDLLDRLSQRLCSAGQWKEMYRAFSLVKDLADGSTVAQYAYILGRVRSLGLLKEGPEAGEFFRTAFEESDASFYYRGLSASFLGESVEPLPPKSETRPSEGVEHWEKLDFIFNFFRSGCDDFAYPYAQAALPRLSISEIRLLAEAFAGAERWGESIRIISAGVNRGSYEIQRQDMELLYPRPFADIIEENALGAELPREILFGLIRTESFFFPDIVSSAGAVGLAQLMPATALDMAGRIARQGGPDYVTDGGIDLKNPGVNVHLGAWYLNYLVRTAGSPVQALIAYNGGIGRVRRWRRAMPALPEDLFLETIEFTETREYGRRVLAAATAYGYLYYGLSMEGVIADIYRGL
ncbi:MAG: lytic transglycosylase domain-containing protein [Spirochaetaceae bacterium]|jgi:soluble lytic murein transglycosylase|nr:lytic transglycosylase domain-containing protein [Spirochaetaceae bacterium]